MNNPERVEAVAWINSHDVDCGDYIDTRAELSWTPGGDDRPVPLYHPAAVAALLRGMVPPKVNELLPEDQAYNAALADVRANIARWEAEGKK